LLGGGVVKNNTPNQKPPSYHLARRKRRFFGEGYKNNDAGNVLLQEKIDTIGRSRSTVRPDTNMSDWIYRILLCKKLKKSRLLS